MSDGTVTNVKSVEFFPRASMVWLRGQSFENGSIVEVMINGHRRSVESIENKKQVSEIRLKRD
jgi:hypothetical protein